MENGVNASYDTEIRDLKRWFEEAEDASYSSDQKAQRDRDYYDNKQLTDAELKVLQDRKQPAVTFNFVRARIDYLKGLAKKQRRDPKAWPRNPQDQEAADAFTDGMRYAVEASRYDEARGKAFENILIEGVGGVEWSAEQGADGEIAFVAEPIPWERLFIDPHSKKLDASDAKYIGLSRWMDLDDIVGDYGDAGKEAYETERSNTVSQSGRYDDRPSDWGWYDTKRNRVRVVTIWYRKRGEWHWCEFSGSVKFGGGPSPYRTRHGESLCPLIINTAYIDRENNRYGVVRDLIDPQDEYNKRRSKLLHLANTRQVRQTEEHAEVDRDNVKREVADPTGFIPWGVDIVPTADIAAINAQLLASTQSFIMQQGPNAALLGKGTEEQSGRAIEAQQAGGLIELGDLMDALRQIDRRSFKLVAAMMQQFWTSERWVRVTDDPMTPRYVGLNVAEVDDFGQVVGMQNYVPELDLDIVIEDAPDTISLEGPAYEAMQQVLMMAGRVPPQVLAIAIEANPALPVAKKKRLLDMVEQMQGGGQQGPDPAQQQMMALQGRKAEADIAKTEADALRSFSQAQAAMVRAQQPAMTAMPA